MILASLKRNAITKNGMSLLTNGVMKALRPPIDARMSMNKKYLNVYYFSVKSNLNSIDWVVLLYLFARGIRLSTLDS